MDILMTGATGYVGRPTLDRLILAGHRVTAALRDASRADQLPKDVAWIEAGMDKPEAIVTAAKGHDVVLHLGFPSHGGDWFAAVEVEAQLIRALAQAFAGTKTRLIVTNGTIFLDGRAGPIAETAEPLADHPGAVRARATRPATTTPGLSGAEVRLASFVYGRGGSVFLPVLAAAARKTGEAVYVGEGAARLSAVHVDDAAAAFAAVVEHADATGIFHIASDESPTIRHLAHAIAAGTGARALSVTQEVAAARLDPFTAMFLATPNRLASSRARSVLSWQPAAAESLIWDVAFGSYADG